MSSYKLWFLEFLGPHINFGYLDLCNANSRNVLISDFKQDHAVFFSYHTKLIKLNYFENFNVPIQIEIQMTIVNEMFNSAYIKANRSMIMSLEDMEAKMI